MKNIILLTGTIQVSGQNNHFVRTTEERLNQYITNLIKYIIDSPFSTIIFCENSLFPFQEKKILLQNIAEIYNKRIEILQFQGDHEKTQKQGRGYGECEILEYVLDNSLFLKEDNPFIKITGRYFLTNAHSFSKLNTSENMFVRMIPYHQQCSTACYITTPSFYRKHLRSVGNKVDDTLGIQGQLEGVFYRQLINAHTKISPFAVLPTFEALTGSGYILKPNYIKDSIKNMFLTLGLYTI